MSFSSCRLAGCPESAISFSDFCWHHIEKPAYLSELPGRIRALGGKPAALNFKKVEAAGLDFTDLDLRGSSFSQTHLSSALFIGTNLSGCDFIGARLNACDFVGADMAGANLTRAVLSSVSFSHADLRRTYLVEAHLKEVEFLGTLLFGAALWGADLSGVKHLKKKNFYDPDSPERRPRFALAEKSGALSASESYRALKHYFHRVGLYEDASWAAYRELTAERKYFFETRDMRFFPSLLMDLLSGYTEKPNRVIVSSLAVVVSFGLLYYLFNVPMLSVGDEASRAGFWNSLYFSFITFTTVGYGDWIPRAFAGFRILVCLEAFAGPFMAGLYVFTLTRRYAAS